MKRLALVLAIVMVAAFTAPAMADMKVKGSYRMVGMYQDQGYVDTTQQDNEKHVDQRFRLQFDFKANDNVSSQLRMDLTEDVWGDYATRPSDTGAVKDSIQIDRAFVTVKNGAVKTKVGLQAGSIGLGSMWADQFVGITADVALKPVTLKLVWTKESEGTADVDDDDTDVYGISAAYKADAFTLTGSAMTKIDQETTTDNQLNAFSATLVMPIASLKLSAELTTFTGEVDATTDYAGTQLYAALDAKLTDQVSGTLSLLWAADVDGTESQATGINHDLKFRPIDFEGGLKMDSALFDLDGGIGLEKAQIFDLDLNGESAGSAGVLGGIAAVKIAATDAVTIYGKVGYFVPNEDSQTAVDSVTIANASVDYKLMPKVTLSAGVMSVSPEFDDTTNDDTQVLGTFELGVSF